MAADFRRILFGRRKINSTNLKAPSNPTGVSRMFRDASKGESLNRLISRSIDRTADIGNTVTYFNMIIFSWVSHGFNNKLSKYNDAMLSLFVNLQYAH